MASSEYLREDAQLRQEKARQEREVPRANVRPAGGLRVSSNAAAQRILRSAAGASADPSTVDTSVEETIQGRRGGGQELDGTVSRTMGERLGADFSSVRVHADDEADALNRSVRADAFTVGNDIFFRRGNYNPGTSQGNQLLAHELTHVVQQRGTTGSGSGMTVSDPEDASEQQAAAVSEQVTSAPAPGGAASVARQEAPEEEELQMSPHLARAAEEEEELQASPHLAREAVEEEELQMSPHLDRAAEEEEELQMSPHLDRAAEEEEELQMSPHLDRAAEEEEELQASPHLAREEAVEAEEQVSS